MTDSDFQSWFDRNKTAIEGVMADAKRIPDLRRPGLALYSQGRFTLRYRAPEYRYPFEIVSSVDQTTRVIMDSATTYYLECPVRYRQQQIERGGRRK